MVKHHWLRFITGEQSKEYTTTAHKKAYAITYTGKKPADIEVGLAVLGERGGISVMLK